MVLIEEFHPAQVAPTLPPVRTRPPTGPCGPPRDCSPTRFESRLAFPGADDGEDAEIATLTRRARLRDVTIGLLDYCPEEEEGS